jgi:hypothetical protein
MKTRLKIFTCKGFFWLLILHFYFFLDNVLLGPISKIPYHLFNVNDEGFLFFLWMITYFTLPLIWFYIIYLEKINLYNFIYHLLFLAYFIFIIFIFYANHLGWEKFGKG